MTGAATSDDAQATTLLVGRFGKGDVKALSRTEYNRVAQSLHQHGLRPADLFTRVPTDLPVEPDRLKALISRGTALALATDKWDQSGIRIVSRADAAYPSRFRKLLKGSASPIMFQAGDPRLLELPTIGVVGSRDATDDGLSAARRLGERAASEKVVIVSGDARGVDRAAMDAALESGGKVIGILADSLAKSVLSKRYRLAIADGRLLLLSPNEPEARFTVAHAMERNRYIYAASDAVVVSDSDVKGGTWNGALENLRHRWTAAHVRVDGECREGNAALVQEGLLPWRSSWFDENLRLDTLFQPSGQTSSTLPLFAEVQPASGGGGDEAGTAERNASYLARPTDVAGSRPAGDPATRRSEDHVSRGEDPLARAPGTTTATPATGVRERDILFDVFIAGLARALTSPAPATGVANHFDIEVRQAELWLDRARRLGKVKHRGGIDWEWQG